MHFKIKINRSALLNSIFGLLFLVPTALFSQQKFNIEQLNDPKKNGPAVSELLNTIEVYEYKKDSAKNQVFLTAGLRSSNFDNIKEWNDLKDTVEAYRVDIVYSKYPLRDGKYLEIYPLLFQRMKNLLEIDPYLNTPKISWNKILQTHCIDDNQVSSLFHGIVIWYRTDAEKDAESSSDTPVSVDKADNDSISTFREQTTVEELMKNVDDIKTSLDFSDSLKKSLDGMPLYMQMKHIKEYLEDQMHRLPDVELSKATEKQLAVYNKAVDNYLSKFPTSDRVVSAVLDRHPEWENIIVVNDWTGSMYCYGAQVLKWQMLNFEKSGITSLTLFNDGDGKADGQKEIGNTGGIYSEKADNIPKLLNLFQLVMLKGNGGDTPENDVEAILKAIEEHPDCSNVVLIADHNACVKDIELADRIKMPVKVILCGYDSSKSMNPDYVYLAKITNGGIYTIENDIENLQVILGEKGEIISATDKRFKLRRFKCNSPDLLKKGIVLYNDLKVAEHKKHDVYMLDLSGNNLTEFPPKICKMPNLFYLNLSNNHITELPDRIGKLHYLKTLNLSNNEIADLPDNIKEINYIENLNLSHNKFIVLTSKILFMGYLQTLDVSYNNISKIDNQIYLRSLTKLNLSNNSIKELPKTLVQLSRLKYMDLSNNQISTLPNNFTSLSKLEELNIENNNLTVLPAQIYKLKKLKVLKLAGNDFSPEEKDRIQKALPKALISF